jgi:C-terminal peptidase prc
MLAPRTFRCLFAGLMALATASTVRADESITEQSEAKAQPLPAKRSGERPAKLLERAAKAEANGDWEAAFAAYCELPIANRAAPEVREKVNAALRRVQQLRRHRDPAYQQFVTGLASADAVNLFAEVTAKVPELFTEANKATPQRLWSHGLEELHRALSNPAFRQLALEKPSTTKVAEFQAKLHSEWAKRPIGDAREARAALKQLLAAAQESLGVRFPAALAIEVVSGACSGLDEYTVFLNPSQAVEATEPTLDLAAYGLGVRFINGRLVVESVQPGSWAGFNAPQFLKGVRISRINGCTMDMAGPDALAEALRHPANGLHEIELAGAVRSDEATVRLPMHLPTVWHRIVGSKDGIGYIRIGEFQANTPADLDLALAGLRASDVRAILLDLRGNRGGSFVAAVEVAKRFLPAGLIVTTQGQVGEVADRVFSSDFGMRATEVPLVVLIDSETASAAEVVAAALRDNTQRAARVALVGMPTFGKGTIQYPLKLAAADELDAAGKPRHKSGTVRVTIARLIAPNGTSINGVGITPEFIVADPARQWEVALDLLAPMPPSPGVLPPSQ